MRYILACLPLSFLLAVAWQTNIPKWIIVPKWTNYPGGIVLTNGT